MPTPAPRLDFRTLIRRLARHHGRPPASSVTDPFALILREQVAYLATDARREAAFRALRVRVGLTPSAIAHAKPATLRTIARLGGAIAPELRAERMQRSAELVLRKWSGELRRALALPLEAARKALGAFPMIGEPGADRILATCGAARLVPLDSNALRVVTRLGLVKDARDYRTWYRSARVVTVPPPRTSTGWGVEAGQLLRQHGQLVCRARAPRCTACPLRPDGPTGRAVPR